MASSANSNQVPKLYRSVIEDVINEVRELFLDEGVDEQVLMELKTLWENKLMQSKAVEGFNTEEQAALQAAAQQATQQAQTQQVLLPPQQQASQQQVIVQDPKILQHMSATGMSAATTTATMALPTGVSPYQQLITSQGQILQVVRAANGAQYIIQPQQQMVLQQQVLPQMQPGGGQAPVIQQVRPITQVLAPLQGGLPQVLAPLQGGLPQQTGVIIQPQQVILTGNKVQQNAQEEEYDEEEDEEKEKDGEDGQVEEEPLNSEDDVSDEEDQELFDTENVVVCQYDKIHRSKNKWKFHLKDGIMNLNGRDYVFSKAIGDAEW
ncbi:unnamed protein product [Coregonus sp. 'balchen']|nr:unnamed protein product [Coregonus sp. 'balchen']